MSEDRKEIEALRAAITVLEEENAQLLERAEDAMLLAQVAEVIENVTEPVEILDRMVERVSILKDLPYVTCGRLNDGKVGPIATYCLFSDEPDQGYPILLDQSLVQELPLGPYLIPQLDGITSTIGAMLLPSATLVVPFRCHQYGKCVLLVCCRPDDQSRLAQMVFLLDQVVRMVGSRLDNVFLAGQLELLNAQLEERVLSKTRDLQQAHEQMRRTHERLLTILHGVENYIHVTDTRNYRLLFANEAAKRMFGSDIEGRECFRVLRQQEQPCDFCRIPQLLAGQGMSQTVSWESYNPLTGRWFLNSERIVDWPDSPQALLTVGADISEIKRAEEEKQQLARKLHQAQKMEAIGVLAGSIAHDLNNILSGVVSYPDLLLATLPQDSPLRKGLTTIQAAGIKAAKIVQGLLTMSRRGMQVDEPVELRQMVKDFLASAECRDLLQKHPLVRIAEPAGNEPLTVMGSAAHLANVLMNLVINAAEAMPDGGLIRVELARLFLDRQPAGFLGWRSGAYARLTVIDSGVGIPEEYVERVFDPFFTKKKPGASGTGLGLAVVWGTVIDHRGHVEVETREGQGTSFHILLPMAENAGEPARRRELLVKRGRGQSVLVVDDDPEQRRIASEILSYLGYDVVTAASGEEALAMLANRSVELVLLDMLMPPGIDGLETYERIRVQKPEQKVIIVSGYSRSDRVKQAIELGVGYYLQKPYNLVSLSKAIQAMLEDAAG